MTHHLLDLFVGDEGPVDAADASAAGHVEHVALAEQLLGAHFAENGAAVDFRGDLKRDAGREVRLDGAGDDVDRRPLGGENDVQAGGARHLRQPLHRAFDVLAGDHHQVGHFVDDDHDVGQRIEIEFLFLVDRLAGFLVEAGMNGAGQFLALALWPRPRRDCSRRYCARRAWTFSCSALPSRARPISARPPLSSDRSRQASADAGCRHRRRVRAFSDRP